LQLKQARIVGIFDEDPVSIRRALREFSQSGHQEPAVYSDLDALTNDERVDGILICTPNFTHRQVFDAVKHTEKPIFLEKPMATTLEDAIYLAEASLSYPSSILLGMQYRYKSQYQLALNAINKGDVGSVKMISLCEYRPAFLPKVKEWNKFAVYSGGTLVEKCCHYFDLMNRIAASLPARVFASGGRAVNFKDFSYEGRASDIDDHALVIVEYENRVRAQFTLNMFSEELYEGLTVSGDRGTLRAEEQASFKPGRESSSKITVEVPGHAAYDGFDCTFPEAIESGGHYGSTLFEHVRFANTVRGQQSDGASCAEGLWAIITAWMAQESIRTSTVVDVRETLTRLGIDPFGEGLTPDINQRHISDEANLS
jgi:predicted dehydrogenase